MLKILSIQNHLSHYIKQIDKEISFVIQDNFINDIAKRVCFGGKRIRPIVLILISKMLGGKNEDAFLNASIAIELIHLASLLHDDVIDGGVTRHGKDTAHLIFGNEQVILGGDFLFAESFKKITQTNNIEVIKVVANVSSILARGELEQLQTKVDSNTSFEKYFEIIYKKTASLFEASTGIAAIIQDVKAEELFEFGKNIGITFQVIDDLLDYTSKEAGKKQGTDFFESKVTLPIIIASQNKITGAKLNEIFAKSDKTESDFIAVKNILTDAKAFEECKYIANDYLNKAKIFISSYSQTREAVIMLELLEFFKNRIL
jgi:octaprenyl-diphosphate synthase